MYRVVFTTESAAERDQLAPERRDLLNRGLANLAKDPMNAAASAPYRDDPRVRFGQVAPGMGIVYDIIDDLVIVVVVRVLDESFADA
ncbi:hypothetical protein [Streptacidiphilus cavernicola]|uniref:Type II toxin-antitoxin system RelE/ParE family toxin n=1 Tax=Streptacidiphilus cavernicola TaxID=3342716 RepID=A0ABV6VYF8_9ACTN